MVSKIGAAILIVVTLVALSLVAACGGGGDDGNKTDKEKSETGKIEPTKKKVITIGNLTDLTGVSAEGISVVNMSLKDIVRYYNETNRIPGVELKVVEYDGQYDPSKDVPGYEWLRQRGADLIYTGVPPTAASLKNRVNADKVPLFTCSINLDDATPPGYVFCVGIVPEIEVNTILKWVSENDPDFPKDRPAKIGGAGWTDAYSPAAFKTAEQYAKAHPDQFKWIGGYLTNFSFSWDAEAHALKDADYVFAPNILTTFIRQYRDAGAKGKVLAEDPQMAFWELYQDSQVIDELDGTLVLRSSKWWTDEGELLALTKELLYKYHPESADAVKDKGVGYLGISQAYAVVEAIRATVEKVGAENFTSEALYEAAQSVTVKVDGVDQYSFTPTKRTAINYYLIYEIRAERDDMVRVSDWYPVAYMP